MKKISSRFCVLIVSCLLLLATGCSAGGAKENLELNVYNWGEYIDLSILDTFSEETGITVNYDTYANNEDMYAKLKSGGSSYDIAIPSDYMIERMIREDMLLPLNLENIPNFKNIDQRFKSLDYDPGSAYSIPYMWGTLGILYNTAMVTDPVDSWNILWDEKYSGQIFMYDSLRDSIGVALKKNGYSLNTKNLDELEIAKQDLIKQMPLVRAYVGDTVRDSMIGNEGAMALVYSGDASYCIGENPDLAYTVPKEGSNIWFDAAVIPKGATNIQAAEKFLDFLCRPDICLKNVEYIEYSTVNSETFKMVSEEMRNDPAFWPTDEIYDRCEVFVDLAELSNAYVEAWTEILATD
ncbi:MAG: ABC transporter substrate-binding protein [Clostridiales bacterium]|jgi:spermidine/putrescine transport system substrate-binding protein|nr:ABC transporter substrate-binding protein [Clostridiales bacterium]MDR2749584.1 ABC transporter substrate-binding protein [Clostridiales bacterium]